MVWRIETCFWCGLTSHSEYSEVSTGIHAVLEMQVIIEGHLNWKFIVTVGCWIWWSFVDIECEGEVTESHWKIIFEIRQLFSCSQNHIDSVDSLYYGMVWPVAFKGLMPGYMFSDTLCFPMKRRQMLNSSSYPREVSLLSLEARTAS